MDAGNEEIFQVAQALILCGMPYDKSDQIRITRTARVADGSIVSVTFMVAAKGGEMLYGSHRTLLHFLFDKVVRSNSRFISWETATEFLKAMGHRAHSTPSDVYRPAALEAFAVFPEAGGAGSV